ncbi:unnamed protein product [Amoebophrya sp. A25]|nr:unnamed protein product [Amoebophrya sp. A25]|eukprot:GSA25T00021678001.1
MKGSSVKFAETDAPDGVYKGSLFKGLFKDKKAVLDGFPAVGKGLAFPEPCLKFGSSTYTFKTSDVVDKVSCKFEDKELVARYKKDTSKWDVFCKVKHCPGLFLFGKYEEKGEGVPFYVVGADVTYGPMMMNLKTNFGTGLFKKSFSFDASEYLKGLKIAGDLKGNAKDLNPALFAYNCGLSYSSQMGTTVLGVSSKKKCVLNHALKVDSKTTAVVEVVASAGNSKSFPLTMGVSHQYDKAHQVKVRANNVGHVQCCLKKDVSPNLSLLYLLQTGEYQYLYHTTRCDAVLFFVCDFILLNVLVLL